MKIFSKPFCVTESSLLALLLMCVIVAFGFKAYLDGFHPARPVANARKPVATERQVPVAPPTKLAVRTLQEASVPATGHVVADQ